jgi:hypothetical protein
MTTIKYRIADVDGFKIFYREAGRRSRRRQARELRSR